MEHRWSMRKQLGGRARLSCPNGAAAQAMIHDLSLGGVGLVTHCKLAPGICVQLSFVLDDDLDRTSHSLLALVVHGDSAHAGLVFLDAAPRTLQMLRTVLHHPDHPRVAAPSDRRVA